MFSKQLALIYTPRKMFDSQGEIYGSLKVAWWTASNHNKNCIDLKPVLSECRLDGLMMSKNEQHDRVRLKCHLQCFHGSLYVK